MYDRTLEVFREVADRGSFSKAAEGLFLTHTAVIKQLNHLENRMGVQLLERSNQGVRLTPAGEVLYREAGELIRHSREAVKRVQAAGRPVRKTLRVGSSALSPCQVFLELWQQKGLGSRFQFQIIPFSDDRRRYEHLGKNFDFLIGPYNNPSAEEKCRFIPIGRYRFVLLMNREHRLAGKSSLKFKELRGETILHMKPGTSPVNDNMRALLLSEASNIVIEDILPIYNMETFNRCVESGGLLLSPECWSHVHPALTAVPLDENFSIAYGVIAARTLGEDMEMFLRVVKEELSPENT